MSVKNPFGAPTVRPMTTRPREGPDDGHPRHDWCRATDCISCGCSPERPCDSHSEARGYVDWVKARGLGQADVSATIRACPNCGHAWHDE